MADDESESPGITSSPDSTKDVQEVADDIIDLDSAPVPVPPPPSKVPPSPPPGWAERDYTLALARDNIRGVIAKWLVLLLAAIVIVPFWFIAWRSGQAESVKEILQIVIGPVVALVGSATGYYFGVERGSAPPSGSAVSSNSKASS